MREGTAGQRGSGTLGRPSGESQAPNPVAPVSAPPAPIEVGAAVEESGSGTPAPPAKVAAPRHALAASPQGTPEDMLRNANDLRARHQWLAATQLYEKTLRSYPGRAEAYSAMVAAGVLRLDQLGDAKGAMSRFSSAVRARPRGPLLEEARWGAIQAYRSLGDGASEQVALQEFVTAYPDSLVVTRARARLHELRGEPTSP